MQEYRQLELHKSESKNLIQQHIDHIHNSDKRKYPFTCILISLIGLVLGSKILYKSSHRNEANQA